MKTRIPRRPPVWKLKHDAYIKTVGNVRLIKRAKLLVKRLRYGIGIFSVLFVTWIYWIFRLGIHSVESNGSNPIGAILIVAYFGFIVILYKSLLHWTATLNLPTLRPLQSKCFNAPDYSKYLKNNERIPIENFPDPKAGTFALATTGRDFIWWSFSDETHAGHLLVVSKPQRYGRDNLTNVLLHYLLADSTRPNVLAMVLDSQGGVQFSPWLRYDYSELVKSSEALVNLRQNVRLAEFRDSERLPRVAVFDHDPDIIGAIKWLEKEMETRLDESSDVFGVKRAPIIVLVDEEVSRAFLERTGKFGEITNSLSNLIFNGKPTNINFILFAPPEMEWSKMRKELKEWFDTIEYPHLTEFGGKDEKEGISKNAIPSFVDLVRVWMPAPVFGKVPYVDPEWSAKQIDTVGDLSTDNTLALWDAMRKIKPWEPKKLLPREERKMPIINNLPEKRVQTFRQNVSNLT